MFQCSERELPNAVYVFKYAFKYAFKVQNEVRRFENRCRDAARCGLHMQNMKKQMTKQGGCHG
ncbi:MAG: hypothetical protein K9L24_03920 [Spirochaetia bacterium]|nr:hypothetical protein [Spirochaetia bacterium]MCF7946897.1 hypothetical protein [Spirochaetia bacterium]